MGILHCGCGPFVRRYESRTEKEEERNYATFVVFAVGGHGIESDIEFYEEV
jgi:hypothetical protein